MDDTNTIYMLNDKCIANSLCADLGAKQRFAVPALSVLQTVNDGLVGTISDVSSILSGAIDGITADVSAVVSAVAVTPEDFSRTYDSTRRIYFDYDTESQMLLLGTKADYLGDKSKMLRVNCSDFIKDGMVQDVEVVAANPHEVTVPGPFLKITWNTDAGGKETYICIRDMVGGLYGGMSPIRVDNLSISLDVDALRTILGYDDLYAYYQFLAGLGEWADEGEIARLSSDISTLYSIGVKGLKYAGRIVDAAVLSSGTFAHYIETELQRTTVPNGAYLPVRFTDNSLSVSTTDAAPLVVGNGDVVVVHDHDDNVRDIPVSELTVGVNVEVLKAGVSRYEYEKAVLDISATSAWIDGNFKNFPAVSNKMETKNDVVVDKELSANVLKGRLVTIGSRTGGQNGDYSVGIGSNCGIEGRCSIAAGYKPVANAPYSVALGNKPQVKRSDNLAFVWQGNEDASDSQVAYQSKGPGTFAVNPVGGKNGIYVGTRNLGAMVANELLDSENQLTAEFLSSNHYDAGDKVVYGGDIYKFTEGQTDVDWEHSHVEKVTAEKIIGGKATKADATLTPVYGGNGEKYSDWMFSGTSPTYPITGSDTLEFDIDRSEWRLTAGAYAPEWASGSIDSVQLTFNNVECLDGNRYTIIATRTSNPIIGYQLGTQSERKLATAEQGAKADSAYQLPSGGIPTGDIANRSITTDKLAQNSVSSSKIYDKNVTKNKLEDSVQASLDKADTAVQPEDVPTKLPNPQPLNFLASSGGTNFSTYDGSEEKYIGRAGDNFGLCRLTDSVTSTSGKDTGIAASGKAVKTVNDKAEALQALVPAQASAQNQLADKDFVNSSIATETATFRGTFNLVTDLGLPLDATREQVAAAVKAELG